MGDIRQDPETGPKDGRKKGNPPALKLPDSLPGLNIRLGLKRLGSEALYVDLVRFLCLDKKDFIDRIKELVRDREYAEARSMAHALKGSAATIAAENLCEAAKNLEFACHEKKTRNFPGLITLVEKELCLIAESALKLPEIDLSPGSGVDPESEPIDIEALFEEMDTAMDNMDPAHTADLASEISGIAKSPSFSEELKKAADLLQRQVGNYLFDDATDTLKDMKRLLESSRDPL